MRNLSRRGVIGLAGGAAVWPVAARAQRDRPARIAVWIGAPETDPQGQRRAMALREALRELGWIEGRSIAIEYHWAVIDGEQVRAETAELVARNPDVIVTTGAPTLAATHKVTSTIPIVFVLVTDPVSDGFVASLARPGGNITGFTIFEHSFAGKWLEMLKEAAPAISRVAVMQNPDHPAWEGYLRAIGTVASPLGVEVTPAPVHNAAAIEHALEAFACIPNGGLILLPSGVAINHHELIARLAARYGVPAIYSLRFFAASGGLMSYGVAPSEPYRQAATYVDRILKGTKPADLPVQASAKFKLIINLKTAKALGLEIPPTLLARADEVIE
jgi:putative tryptophan/tyrosine transport system substrate-binding protein